MFASTIRAVARRAYTTEAAQALTRAPAATAAASSTPATSADVDVSVISGAPGNLATQRVVKIYRPAKTAMQSGLDNTRFWKVDWNAEDRWENPLMGWASSADYMQGSFLKFRTEEEAIRFAERQGWQYEVVEPAEVKFTKKVYAKNFTFVPGKLRYIHTK
ncbi:hypothetical protein GGF32_002989 [Allomyces javanicus]|nr:hypothetical protein GGF32_002989 [Allomyces javanicus]